MKRRQILQWLRYHAVLRPLAFLPLPLAYRAAGLLGGYDARRQANALTVIAAAMQRVLPDSVQPRDARRYFSLMARESLDVFTMPRLAPGETRLARLAPGSLEILQRAKQNGRGVIIAMGHYGRVNLLLLALALAGERLGMLTMRVDERNPDLDAVQRAYLHAKIDNLLAFIGGPWISLGDDLRHLYRSLRGGATLVILFDAYAPQARQEALELPFLGGRLRVARGVERLAAATGAAVVYGVAKERGYGVEAQLRRLPEEAGAVLAAAVAELERDVRDSPWQWWHWNSLEAVWTA